MTFATSKYMTRELTYKWREIWNSRSKTRKFS